MYKKILVPTDPEHVGQLGNASAIALVVMHPNISAFPEYMVASNAGYVAPHCDVSTLIFF